MKKLTCHIAALIALAIASISANAQMPAEIEAIKAPFEMPQLSKPVFSERSLSIAKTGAKQTKPGTKAIQKAIDRIAAKGGGTVIVPEGKWHTGRIILKSNVNLHLSEAPNFISAAASATTCPWYRHAMRVSMLSRLVE